MSGPLCQAVALVLNRIDQGERHCRFQLLCPESGPIDALWRRTARPNAPPPPDLFDQIEANLKSSNRSKTRFLEEFRIIRSHKGLARNYASFREASAFTRTIWRNLVHAEHFEPLYQLSCDALAAFENGIRPELVHFKALYRLARNEGYPVKEDWWSNLPEQARDEVVTLVQTPVENHPIAEQAVSAHFRSLIHYLQFSTDIVIPKADERPLSPTKTSKISASE